MRNATTDRRLQAATAYWKSMEASCFEQTVFSYGGEALSQKEVEPSLQQPSQFAAEGSSPKWIAFTKSLREKTLLHQEKDAAAVPQIATKASVSNRPTADHNRVLEQVKQHVKA